MKNLKIEYNGLPLFEGEVEELQWLDGAQGVSINAKFPKAAGAPGQGVGGLLEKLVGSSKQQTQNLFTEKRSEYVAE